MSNQFIEGRTHESLQRFSIQPAKIHGARGGRKGGAGGSPSPLKVQIQKHLVRESRNKKEFKVKTMPISTQTPALGLPPHLNKGRNQQLHNNSGSHSPPRELVYLKAAGRNHNQNYSHYVTQDH